LIDLVVVGVVVAILLLLIGLSVVVLILIRKRKRQQTQQQTEMSINSNKQPKKHDNNTIQSIHFMSYRFALICVYNQYFELIRIKSN
jgi:predicted histidine transporter YuiF (NhaC family)